MQLQISYDLMNSWNYFYIDKCSFTSVLEWFKQVGEKVAAWSSLLKIVLAVVIELLVGSIFIQIILRAMLLKFSEAST